MITGILTLPLHNNFGGILQAYALCHILSNIIPQNEVYILTQKEKTFKGRLKKFLDYNSPAQKFIQQYIPINTLSGFTLNEIMKKNITCIVVGSDQVWNTKYYNPLYFLNFLEDNHTIKKISYAASLGSDLWYYSQQQTDEISNLLNKFNAISVRESSAINLLQDNLKIKATQVLDPTLLLQANHYNKFISDDNKRYCYAYLLDYTKKLNMQVLKEIALQKKINIRKTELVKNKMIKRITPQTTVNQWLSNIYNASFVVTDSFHGCVFSILFNKEFVVLPHELGGNARIKSLLKLFNLEERFVHHIDEINIQAPIYWDDVNYSLENLRKESINFLKSNLV